MSLTLIRRLVLGAALAASLLGGGIASAEDGAEPPVEVATAVIEPPPTAEEGDFVYADAAKVAKATLETALTTVLAGCRSGLLEAKVAVVPNELDPSASYILVSEISESGRVAQDRLSPAMLAACVSAMEASTLSKAEVEALLETIMTEMETLLAMS